MALRVPVIKSNNAAHNQAFKDDQDSCSRLNDRLKQRDQHGTVPATTSTPLASATMCAGSSQQRGRGQRSTFALPNNWPRIVWRADVAHVFSQLMVRTS